MAARAGIPRERNNLFVCFKGSLSFVEFWWEGRGYLARLLFVEALFVSHAIARFRFPRVDTRRRGAGLA